MKKPIGFVVIDQAEEWEQILQLRVDKQLPPGGILDWNTGRRSVFPSRYEARLAIDRTEHHRLAYSTPNAPERKNCKIVPVYPALNSAAV